MKRSKLIKIGIVVFLLFCGMFAAYMSSRADPRAQYRAQLFRAANAISHYKQTHGHWPASLTNLADQSILSVEPHTFEYDSTNLALTLSLDLPPEPDLISRLTRDLFGSWSQMSSISIDLAEREDSYQAIEPQAEE